MTDIRHATKKLSFISEHVTVFNLSLMKYLKKTQKYEFNILFINQATNHHQVRQIKLKFCIMNKSFHILKNLLYVNNFETLDG